MLKEKGTPPHVVRVSGTLSNESGRKAFEEVSSALSKSTPSLTIDLSDVGSLDDVGGAWLVRAIQTAQKRGTPVRLTGARGKMAEAIRLIQTGYREPEEKAVPKSGFFETVGAAVWSAWKELREASNLIVDAVYWSLVAPVEGRGIRWRSLLDELNEMGVRALGIVCLINFLLGLIIALLSTAQLRMFGAEIYVANLVVIAFTRELAPVMTAIVVAARSGSAIAAELGTMVVSEEIDALKSMGFSTGKFLIAPKVLALIVVMPILVVLGMVAGTAGGFALGTLFLHFPFDRWWSQTLYAATAGDVFQGFFKSFWFALIIVLVGCHNGLRVQGGARGVGLATTRAVVMDIFFIIVADMVFAQVFYFM